MGYIVEFEICALLFLLVVTVRFFSMRKFKSKANGMFGILLYCVMVNILFDLAGAFLIDNAGIAPFWLNYTVNMLFYMTQVALPTMMFLYVLALASYEMKKFLWITFLPVTVSEVLLITNPFTNLIFCFSSSSDDAVLSHGSLFLLLYISSAIYLVLSITALLRLRHSFRKIEVRTMLALIIVLVVAVVLQMFIPQILVTGVAMSIAILMMFLTMQNPDTMLDSITGTFNYSALTEYLRKQISEGRVMWITAVDVGGIRRINSIMGIHTGNELLEKVGLYINGICKNRATAFRMIGTRFIIISENFKVHKEIVSATTQRFHEPWTYSGREITLLATIRYGEQKNIFSSPEDVINLIDIAYSRTVEEGFGTTKPIDSVQLEQFHRKGLVKEAIGRALSSGEGFYLNYQPLYSIKDKKFCGAEALLRLKDPVLGQISPAEFIPIAEDTGLICQIDSLVVGMACGFLKAHPELFDAGLRLLDINLSAMEFNSDTDRLFADISEKIDSLEDKICFEVTETAVTTRREVLSDFMYRLIQRGVRFAIDDFGTGYANITQLAKLPFSVVKLDRIFVSQDSGKEAQILTDLVNMFDHIGLSTVFEGVETAKQAAFASDLGIDQIQGFYYSHPLSEEDLLRLMASGHVPVASGT